jgi:hypothetical protein
VTAAAAAAASSSSKQQQQAAAASSKQQQRRVDAPSLQPVGRPRETMALVCMTTAASSSSSGGGGLSTKLAACWEAAQSLDPHLHVVKAAASKQ